MEINNLKIFETGKMFGNMNAAPRFYNKNLSIEEIKADFLARRMSLGEFYGFDGRKMFAADQVDKKGTYHILTKEDIFKDTEFGWIDIPEDMLIISDFDRDTKGAVIGQPVADCPVVVATDTKHNITTACHCSASLVDIKMPMLTIDALIKAGNDFGYEVKEEHIKCYISSGAGKNWSYDRYPSWASDISFWNNYISENNGIYYIDIKTAIHDQLLQRKVAEDNITVSNINTITNDNFYSNSASRNNSDKAGRNFVGAFYEEEKIGKSR